MKRVSITIKDSVLQETEKMLAQIKMPLDDYVNEALQFYNQIKNRQFLEKKLRQESNDVRDNSMLVLSEFESISYPD